jgi:hypothetical protein
MIKKKKKNLTDTLKTKTEPLSMPALSEDLINALDERFPEQSADLKWTEKEIWYKSGQRSVIKFLLTTMEEQNEDVFRR